jgi:hypothetical protein
MKDLLKIGIRQNAILVTRDFRGDSNSTITETTAGLVANLSKLGFEVSETLLHALNGANAVFKLEVLNAFREVLNVGNNWAPLVKGWQVPTGENYIDHLVTWFVNLVGGRGTRLDCGHIIPVDTFPLERYNGCPFCGTPFEFGGIEKYGQGSKKKLLQLWTEEDLQRYYVNLLESKTALDATQVDSLKTLLAQFPLPTLNIGMKETQVLVIRTYVDVGKPELAQVLVKTPNDVLRYLWFEKTGFLQIIEPSTIVRRKGRNQRHITLNEDKSAAAKLTAKAELELKYDRKTCRTVATWLNDLPMSAEQACEIMHAKRGMWVRFFRALRLAEYAKKESFQQLARLVDVFYRQDYTVWQASVNHFRLRSDAERTFQLLKERPGLFARSLFANMLWFGPKTTVEAFEAVIDRVPARLVFTLNMYAQLYFQADQDRTVRPLGAVPKAVPAHRLLKLYSEEQLEEMKAMTEELCLSAMKKRFAGIENTNKTIFIDPLLFNIPLSIGDRSETVQDLPSALIGTRFPLEDDQVRLFMQWGKDLPAQHLDMDLSCYIAFDRKAEICSYACLVATGCKHSGDIRSIPEKVGTAEYIELDLNALAKAGARYLVFTCNAYSNGEITPNLVLGWMNSKFQMQISEETGVAYDPSCVQHQVRITQGLTKGLVFGVLEVETKEIIWLEMPFQGQVVQHLDLKGVNSLLAKINSKMSVGNLLVLKAEAQNLQRVNAAEDAQEVYDKQWAIDAAGVTKLFLD